VSDESPTDVDQGAWIPFLVRKRRFAECMILAWQDVEYGVDQMTIQEYGLRYLPEKIDPRVDILRDNVGFRVKVNFLKEACRLSSTDAKTIHEFADERNKLFHGNVFSSPHPIAISEDEKTRLMKLARQASQIALNRGFGVWFDVGTGDIENKDAGDTRNQGNTPARPFPR
jgi:hypothetical protein